MVCVPAALQTPGEANLPFETVPKRKVVLLLHLFFSSQKKERKRKKNGNKVSASTNLDQTSTTKEKIKKEPSAPNPCALHLVPQLLQLTVHKTAGASFLFLFRFENMKYDSFLGFENIKCWERRNLPGRTRGAPADQRAPRL